MTMKSSISKRFCVALSFPGEHRRFVRNVANKLAEALGHRWVFFDEWYQTELLGTNGDLKLQQIFRKDSELVVPFFSKHYNNPWCSLEWHAMRAMLMERQKDDCIVAVRMDNTEVAGWLSTDFHIQRGRLSANQIAEIIGKKYISSHRIFETVNPNSNTDDDQITCSIRVRKGGSQRSVLFEKHTRYLTIGRAKKNLLQINDNEVSWEHGVILLQHGEYIYRHLSRTNPTIVRRPGEEYMLNVNHLVEIPLRSQDRVTMGQTILIVEFDIMADVSDYTTTSKKSDSDRHE